MKINDIKNLILSGELVLLKTYLGKKTKRKYVWNEDWTKILKVEMIEYDGWSHMAVEKNNQSCGYRISKKVFNEMMKKLSTGNHLHSLNK